MTSFTVTTQQLSKLLEQAKRDNLPQEVTDRLEWFLHYARNKSVAKTCRQYAIARTTLYRWLKRFDPEDLTTLTDNPRTPEPHERLSYRADVVQAHNGIQKNSNSTSLLSWKAVGVLSLGLNGLIVLGILLNAVLSSSTHVQADITQRTEKRCYEMINPKTNEVTHIFCPTSTPDE